jgi:signal peptidase I
MTLLRTAVGVLVALGLVALWMRGRLLVITVDGTSMEPALRSGDRLLVRRTKRIRTGRMVVFTPPGRQEPGGGKARWFLVKRAVAGPGDRMRVDWEDPDIQQIAGTVVPRGSLVVLGDNRATSWDSRHYGFLDRDRIIGTVVRRLPGGQTAGAGETEPETAEAAEMKPETDRDALPASRE